MRVNVKKITLEEERRMVRDSGILLLLEWDIASKIALDTIRKQDQ